MIKGVCCGKPGGHWQHLQQISKIFEEALTFFFRYFPAAL
jgi:hypothetical protein